MKMAYKLKLLYLGTIIIFHCQTVSADTPTTLKDGQAHRERAIALVRSGNLVFALQEINKAINLDPQNGLGYAYRAAIHIEGASYKDALSDINKSISLNPNLAIAYSIRAVAHERLKDYKSEVTAATKAIELDPRVAKYFLIRATARTELGLYQLAIQDCNKALSICAINSNGYIRRGYAYKCLRKHDKALQDYTIALKIAPNSTDGRLLRAELFEELGDYHQQIDDLSAALKVRPMEIETYEKRALAYYRLGELQNAIDDCNKVSEFSSMSIEAIRIAAWSYEDLGCYEKAIERRTKLSRITPKDASNWSARAYDLDKIGSFAQAQIDRKTAVKLVSAGNLVNLQMDAPLVDFDKSLCSTSRKDIQRQLEQQPVILPFEYNGEHIIVRVSVDGRPLKLMLDTGCGKSTLFKRSLPSGARLATATVRRLKANNNWYLQDFFRAKELKLDRLVIPEVAFAVQRTTSEHIPYDGYLGSNILENFVVTVDFTVNQVRLTALVEPENTEIVLPMITRNHRPSCLVMLNGKRSCLALLDTGSSFNVSADSLLKIIILKKLSFDETLSGQWLGRIEASRVKLKSLGLGAFDLKSPAFMVFPARKAPEMAEQVVLGLDTLRHFNSVTFNFPARRVIFRPK